MPQSVEMYRALKSQNVPIGAFGLQAHLYGNALQKLNPKAIQSFFKSISDMGLKILITELDVQDKGLPNRAARLLSSPFLRNTAFPKSRNACTCMVFAIWFMCASVFPGSVEG